MSRGKTKPSSPKRRLPLFGLGVLLAGLVLHLLFGSGGAAPLGPRSLQISTAIASQTADYQLSFELSTAGTLGSVDVQFCSNTAIAGDPCTAPTGFNISAATLADQDAPGDFTIGSGSTANELILTRTPSSVPISLQRFHFTGVTNPSVSGSYFVRVQTYATSDVSGPSSDYGGIAFYINTPLSVNATVPPFLVFCTGVTIPGLNCANAVGDYIDFGELSAKRASSGTSQMLVGTNAASGYNITVNGTTMTSGNNVITAIAGGDVSRPGAAQFGFNLRANTTPAGGQNPTGPGLGVPQPPYNQPNIYRFNSGDTLVNYPQPEDSREFTSNYIVNVPATQAPGVYVSTITYIALADF